MVTRSPSNAPGRPGAIILGKTNIPTCAGALNRSIPSLAAPKAPGTVAIRPGKQRRRGVDHRRRRFGPRARQRHWRQPAQPAANNGCVSLKPTTGRVPDEGHVPTVPPPVNAWNHAGPLARRVEDLALALGVLDGSGEADLSGVEGIRCRVFTGNRSMIVSPEVKSAVRRAAAHSDRRNGSRAEPGFADPEDDHALLACAQKARIAEINAELRGRRAVQLARGSSTHPHRPGRISAEALSVYAYIAYGGVLKPGPGDADRKLERLRRQVIETVGDGVLVCPLLLVRPARHGATWLPFTQIPMAVPFNITGLPVAMVPVYWTANGLPLSVQVVAGPGKDELALAAARELEERLGGWKPID